MPPVLSFALGSLGFLTKFDYSDHQDTLTTAFKDGITVSLRLRFEATIMRTQTARNDQKHDLVEELIGVEAENNLTHKPDGSYTILNDIVVDRGPNPSTSDRESLIFPSNFGTAMSSTELFMDEKFMTSGKSCYPSIGGASIRYLDCQPSRMPLEYMG